ncbi:rhamnan synthesis F family protein [Brucella gallinifaecis]|uniref:rhamnosyltransferase WsaF family glycosyltransferase n=1 Tax=Brucella gallinifaecis TaxID=215590 RepID=UPI0023614BB2|nr:rhamnan synthesis F family protein [Brucella gallinifaecis]
MYYIRRACYVLQKRGVKALFSHTVTFIKFKLRVHEKYSYITDQESQGGKLNAIGAVTARTLPDDVNPSLHVPTEDSVNGIVFDKAAVIAHIFYPELTEEIVNYLRNIPIPFGFFVTTDSEEKKTEIYKVINQSNLDAIEIEIRVTPNRGRDIAPKYIGFRDIYDRYDVFLHIHSKKSLHAEGLGNVWREYLFRHLIGSPDIAKANLKILSTDKVGVVYPEHAEEVKEHINWGYDFPIAKDLLSRIGLTLDSNTVLEFPSGSMFWARSQAIRHILDLNLDFDDFPEEDGQIDGTLAHAIERSLLYFVERTGHSWVRVTTRSPKKSRLQSRFIPLLGSEQGAIGRIPSTIAETVRILAAPQQDDRLRLNLMLPIIDPAAIFGGIDTALKIFDELLVAAGEQIEARIIVTEARVGDVPDRLKKYVVQQIGQETPAQHVVLDATQRRGAYLDVRSNDVFIATAWWTALNAFRLQDFQKSFFGAAPKVIYLIQDFEPDFYGWSTRYALAESTYLRGKETIALINSEELLDYFQQKYEHPVRMLIPYEPNAKVDKALTEVPREKIILFYSRPSALRNCFEAGIDGLILWARRNPVQASEWKVYCIGEEFDPELARGVPNCTITGKMPLEEYAGLLSRASVGLSLMISPHPSYPPLEMAYAGVRTLTNNYANKNLAKRSDLLKTIDIPTPELIASALEDLVNVAEVQTVGKITPIRNKIRNLHSDVQIFNAPDVVRLL